MFFTSASVALINVATKRTFKHLGDNFLDDASFLQLFYFLNDELLLLWRLATRLLLDGACVGTHG